MSEIFAGVNQEVGMLGAALGDEGRDQVGHDGRHSADSDATVKGRMVAQFLGGVLDLEEDAAGTFEEGGAGFREDRLAAEAVKQLVADFAL